MISKNDVFDQMQRELDRSIERFDKASRCLVEAFAHINIGTEKFQKCLEELQDGYEQEKIHE